MAATLSVPAGAISGASAAALHGFEGWKRAAIEVATRHGTTHRCAFGTVRETRTVGRFAMVEGIRVVSPADCIVQMAASLDAEELGAMLDLAAATRRTLLAELRDRYAVLARRRLPGIAVLRAALAARGEGYVPVRTELERRLRAVVQSVVALPVEFEASPPWVEPDSQRVDVLIPRWRLIVEGDGRSWHTRVADFERDRERDAVALANGYATLRLTWHQLTQRRVWCRNVLVAVGAQRSGPNGRPTTSWAASSSGLWLPADPSGPRGGTTTASTGSTAAAWPERAQDDPARVVA
jgi:hypothetical protein